VSDLKKTEFQMSNFIFILLLDVVLYGSIIPTIKIVFNVQKGSNSKRCEMVTTECTFAIHEFTEMTF